MGSSFFGRPNMRGGGGGGSPASPTSPTSSSSSPATRRGKKNGSDKPKQPQRGLGVAQLEKIRLHGEISCNNSFNNFNPSLYPQEDMRMQGGYTSIPSSSSSFSYASSSSSSSPSSATYGFHPNMMMGVHRDQYERATMSWNTNYGILESQHSLEPTITRHFLHEDPSSTRRSKSLGSGNQNSGSNEKQELDLELRLSL